MKKDIPLIHTIRQNGLCENVKGSGEVEAQWRKWHATRVYSEIPQSQVWEEAGDYGSRLVDE